MNSIQMRAQSVPRLTLLASALALALFTPGIASAAAQTPAQASTALPAGGAVKRFAIPAGPLAAVLDRFGRTAGVNLSFDPALIAGISSDGVQGSLGIEAALRALLHNTGLEAVAQAGGAGPEHQKVFTNNELP